MHIVIAGMIGAGKSTLSEYLGRQLDIPVHYESVEDNPYLEKLYNAPDPQIDPNRYGFLLQLFFFNHRYRAIKGLFKQEAVILDRSIYEDLHFATVLTEEGAISEEELLVYKEISEKFLSSMSYFQDKTSPDVLIYLRGDFDTIMSRINTRGREMETKEENIAYFRKLWERYDEWLNDYYKFSPILIIDIEDHDWREDDVLEKIANKVIEINKGDYQPGDQITL